MEPETTAGVGGGPTFACLPWYDLPETRGAHDALWSSIVRHLARHGVTGVPQRLSRGRPVLSMLTDPALLLGQCCGYDVAYGFSGAVTPVGTPRYAADGCEGANYSSFVLVREDSPAAELADLRGGVCAINGFNSHSGANAMRAVAAALARDGRFYSGVRVSGGHVASLTLLLAGKADAMAMDCIVHALLTRHRPRALDGTRIIARTPLAPAPPLVTSTATDAATRQRIKAALADAFADADTRTALADLLIDGIAFRPLTDYARIVEIEAAALALGYTELHATTSALLGAGGPEP